MATDVKIPSVGESITEVIISKWLKAEGSQVERDEPLVTLETDKVNVEVTAPESGILTGICKKDNETAKVGDVIAQIEAATAAKPVSKPPPPAAANKAAGDDGSGSGSGSSSGSGTTTPGAQAKQQPDDADPDGTRIMPAAQRLMAEAGVKAQDVQASGPGGRILKEDVQHAQTNTTSGTGASAGSGAAQGHDPDKSTSSNRAAAPDSRTVPAMPQAQSQTGKSEGLEQVVPMSPLRRKVAERLVHAQQTAAILTTFNEVDMTNVMQLRKVYQDRFVKKHGVKLGFMSFFVKAAVDALRAFPEVNAEIRGTDMVYRNFYDIGVAVGGAKGLVVPVVRRAELLSFAELEQTIAAYGVRATAGKLKLEEMQGGTFTISNGGVYGSLMSTPIINPPQSGILGMHTIQERPVGIDGKIELRPMMYLALSYDHRIVDGRGAVSFLKRIKECIEAPDRMLLEI